MTEQKNKIANLEAKLLIAVDALEYYASPWGPAHGKDEQTNMILMEVLNAKGDTARKALAEIGNGP